MGPRGISRSLFVIGAAAAIPTRALAKTTRRAVRLGKGLGLIVDENADTLSVLDLSSGRLTHSVPTGARPARILVDRTNRRAFVANFSANTVTIVDLRTFAVSGTLGVDAGPGAMAYDASADRLYVCAILASTVVAIEMRANTRRGAVVGAHPNAIGLDAAANPVVVNSGSGEISYLETGRGGALIARTLPLADATSLAISPDGRTAYVGCATPGTIAIVDLQRRSVRSTIAGLHGPSALAMSPDGRRLYVAESASSSLATVDTSGAVVIGRVSLGTIPTALALSPDAKLAATSDYQGGTISTVDLATSSVRTLRGLGKPRDLALLP